MSEAPVRYLLNPEANHVIMDAGPPDIIEVSRAELLKEYGLTVARAQHLGEILGLPPLMTGQQRRKESRER